MRRPCPQCGHWREVQHGRQDIPCRKCSRYEHGLEAPDTLEPDEGEWRPDRGGVLHWHWRERVS